MTLRAAASGTLSSGSLLGPSPRPEAAAAPLPPPIPRRNFGAENLQELQSIFRESQVEFRGEALLSLAGRMSREGRLEGAAELYQLILAGHGTERQGRQARQGLEVLQGRGATAMRLEFLGRNFVAQATDPAMILAFGLAGGLAACVRAGGMASLALRAPSLFTRGLGARTLVGVAAYLAEVPAFVGSHRLARNLLDPEAVNPGWGQELAGAALFLGALKFTGFLGRELPAPAAFSPWIHRASTGLGIYAGQRLEERFGLRPASDGVGRWLDLAETWLQLHVGGRIAEGLAGPSHLARWEGDLLRMPEALGTEAFRRLPRQGGFEAFLRSQAAAEVDEGDDSPTVPNFHANLHFHSSLQANLGVRATPRVLERAAGIGQAMENEELFNRVLGRTRISDAQTLELALLRLRHSVQNARDESFGGNYVDCIARFSLAKILRTGDARALDQLLRQFHEGTSLGEFEKWAGGLFEGYRLVPQGLLRQIRPIPGYLISRNPAHRRIRSLPISLYGRDLLHRFADLQGDLTEYQIQRLEEALRPSAGLRDLFERILTMARPSPLSYLRLWRMIHLVQSSSNQLPRLQELASPRWALRSATELTRYPSDVAELTNTVEDAFMNDADLSGLLGEFYERLPQYLDPALRQERQLRTRLRLTEIWNRERDFNRPALERSLRALGDPTALALADNLENDRLDFFLVSPEKMEEISRRFYPEEASAELPKGLFISAQEGLPRDTIYLQTLREFRDPYRVLDRLASMVHEHEHFLRPPQRPRTTASARVEEMIAVLRSLQWRAEHGETSALEELLASSPVGFAMSLRALIERWYLVTPGNRS